MSGDSVQLSAKENGVYFASYEQRVLSEMSAHLYSAHAGSVDSRRKWMKTKYLGRREKDAFAEKRNSRGSVLFH